MPDDQLRIRAVTAEEYWIPSVRLADAHTRSGGSAWMYRLDFAEPTGRMANEAYHALDLSLVWQKLDAIEASDPKAVTLSAQIHQAWVAFIHGKAPAALDLPAWPRYNPGTRPTMILAPQSRIEERPFDAELQLWNAVL
jgi:para-nitrobenzyl esterase